MTVTTDIARIAYTGDGSSAVFAFPYYFLAASDIHVFVNFIEVTTGFTVTGAGNQAGGSVAFSSAPAAGAVVQLIRDPDLLQQTKLPPNDPFPSDAVEKALDKLTMIVQARKASEAHTVHFQEVETTDGTLPLAGQRANQVFGFDANGNITMIPMPSSLGAGDLRFENGSDGTPGFKVGVDFIGGSTTTLPLSRAPIGRANCWAYWDGVPQLDFTVLGNTIIFPTAIPAYISVVSVRIGTTLSLNKPAQGSVTDDSLAPGSMVYNRVYKQKTVLDYGAVGDGVHDDSAAFQAAINSGVCRIPYSAKGYMIKTPLNATNMQSLTIEGVASVQAAWSLGYVNPMGGSILYGNTGSWVLDITGSNNVVLRNFSICCLPQFLNAALPNLNNPAVGGIIGGTSNNNPAGLNYPGGMGYIFENIAVWMDKAGASIPIYINNGNIGRFTNIFTLGQYGICLVASNPLSATPVYTSFGPITESDTNIISGAFNAGYGQNAVMYFERCNDLTVLEAYHTFGAGLAGGPYSGVGYSTYINNCANAKLKIGCDSFPFLFRMDGVASQIDIEGLISQGSTPTPVGNPSIGFINCTQVLNCKFRVIQFDARPNNNYLYATQGTAVLSSMVGCEFVLDNSKTPNMIFFNATNANPIPYFNLNFSGNQDFAVGTSPMVLQVAGSPAGGSAYRINMNGNRQGSA
ncbi:parallel beta-helix repeat-containing protein [Caballeronia peredens]|nr:parallel beta-helix repeat-containing protein [Caballeronia peredens]